MMNDLENKAKNESNSIAQPTHRRTAKTKMSPEANNAIIEESDAAPKPKRTSVGVRIRALRQAKDLTLMAVAKNAGLAYQSLQAVENGGDLKLSSLEKIAAALGTSAAALLDPTIFGTILTAVIDGNK